MLDTTTTRFSHVKAADTPWRSDGLRDFFQYRDLGIEQATAGRVVSQQVRANRAPEKGTGWHLHEAQFHIVIMTKGCRVDIGTLSDAMSRRGRTHGHVSQALTCGQRVSALATTSGACP